jgi:hypothetical protein
VLVEDPGEDYLLSLTAMPTTEDASVWGVYVNVQMKGERTIHVISIKVFADGTTTDPCGDGVIGRIPIETSSSSAVAAKARDRCRPVLDEFRRLPVKEKIAQTDDFRARLPALQCRVRRGVAGPRRFAVPSMAPWLTERSVLAHWRPPSPLRAAITPSRPP